VPAFLELVDEVGGNGLRRTEDDDSVIGSEFRPAETALTVLPPDGGVTERTEASFARTDEIEARIDGIDIGGDLGKDGSAVAAADADLEDLSAGSEIELLGGASDDQRLVKGFAAADGDGHIVIGARAVAGATEEVPGGPTHGGENVLVGDAIAPKPVHHLAALRGVVGRPREARPNSREGGQAEEDRPETSGPAHVLPAFPVCTTT